MNDTKHTGSPNDHLANERTFLAWIRTSIAVMGFGFVVVKFSLFVRQISAALGTSVQVHQTGNSHNLGIMLVALGAVMILLAYLRYHSTKVQLEAGKYQYASRLILITTLLIFAASILLLIYLLNSVS
ncbi:YidH family protein [Pedobacter endophyticus]|uniref:DUF202 domain-containing protein n=1 Tax=Pedobacter endophyticus TaxID=2789740 RepID=A0A7S9L150_9SPHI|nr:DUF202 domain-containing protein [Pedobacter endophyticus]QPH40590.1 DUF202 domain-containing protein [Pedobacter endophyticus]